MKKELMLASLRSFITKLMNKFIFLMILRKFINLKNVDFKETGAGVKGIINWNTILDIIFLL